MLQTCCFLPFCKAFFAASIIAGNRAPRHWRLPQFSRPAFGSNAFTLYNGDHAGNATKNQNFCGKRCSRHRQKRTPRPSAPTCPTGGKDSVKENRQGCLSRLIRAGAFKSMQGMRSPRHQQKRRLSASFLLVPLTGIEPVRCFHRGILSPLRLPVPPQRRRAGINLTHLTIALRKSQAQGLTNPHRALYNTLVNSKKALTGSVLRRRPQRESPRLKGFRQSRCITAAPEPSA